MRSTIISLLILITAGVLIIISLQTNEDSSSDLNGTAHLDCSGAVIHFEGFSKDHQAWVVTNGHCIRSDKNKYEYQPGWNFLAPEQVLFNEPHTGPIKIYDGKEYQAFEYSLIIYATMTDNDLALIELKKSYADLENVGIQSHLVSQTPPGKGDLISVYSGYWLESQSCQIEAIIPRIREDVFLWIDSFRMSSKCRFKNGYSGSIVKRVSDKTVLGVFNTANETGEECTIENPCEDWGENKVIKRSLGYGSPLHTFYKCIDKGELALNLSTCKLPKP